MVIARQGPSLMELLGDVGYALDTPGAYLRGLLAARPGERVSGAELFGLEDEGTKGMLGGLLAEMALDPLNLLTAGLPIAAVLGKGDEAADLARAGMSLEDIVSQNKVVDELLAAGVMPEELAEKTLFSREAFRPREGVSAEEVVDAYEGLFPGVADYRGDVFSDDELLGLIREQMAEPVGPALAGFAGNVDESGVLADLDRLADEEGLEALMDAVREERVGGLEEGASEFGLSPLRAMIPESDPLYELLEGYREIQPAQHMTTGNVEELTDLMTSGGNVPIVLDEASGGSWGGRGVYLTTEGKTPAYLQGGRKKLRGTVFTENPLVVPGHYYGPAALQDFIRDNRHLFPELAPGQEDIVGTAKTGVKAELEAGLEDIDELPYHDQEADMHKEAVEIAHQETNFLSHDLREELDEFLENYDLDFDEMVEEFASQRHLDDGIQDFGGFMADKMADYGESSSLGTSDSFGSYVDAVEEVEEASMADEALKALGGFTPAQASDIARRQGYDSVIFTERELLPFGEQAPPNWMDDLFLSDDYDKFRSAVLEDPDFWLEINLLYPETAEKYATEAGVSIPRHGDPGHGQLFNIGPTGELSAGKKIPVPKKKRTPSKKAQKAILAAIGVEGFSRALKSYGASKEAAA